MTVLKVRKVANPRRKARNKKRRTRKMSPKQIRIFGSKRQKAALKAARKRKRKANPVAVKVRRRNRRKVAVRRRRRSNPALVLTLGSVNPRRKRRNKPVARKAKRNRRRVNSHRRRRTRRNPVVRVVTRRRRANRSHRRKRRNPTRVVVVAPRRNRRHRSGHRRRNPALFGHPLFGKDALTLVGGGIVGVTATKFIPTLLPASISGGIGGSNFGRVVITGASAVVAGWAASHVSPQFGQGVLFGGMMQTLSVALNSFLSPVWNALNPGALGDLVPGQFTVPQNPIRAALPVAPAMAPAAPVSMGRAFRSAF